MGNAQTSKRQLSRGAKSGDAISTKVKRTIADGLAHEYHQGEVWRRVEVASFFVLIFATDSVATSCLFLEDVRCKSASHRSTPC